MAYIIEQAGGKATSGAMDILDIVPESIHQRTPIFLGSKEDIEDIVKIFKKYEQTQWDSMCERKMFCLLLTCYAYEFQFEWCGSTNMH